jgi:hypothetical protein
MPKGSRVTARLAAMPERTTSRGRGAPEEASEAGVRAELVSQREEILRLRDLLIRKDLELGAAKGRLAELDERSQRIANLAGRIESGVPGLGRLVGTALRMLQAQRR